VLWSRFGPDTAPDTRAVLIRLQTPAPCAEKKVAEKEIVEENATNRGTYYEQGVFHLGMPGFGVISAETSEPRIESRAYTIRAIANVSDGD